MNAIYVRVSTDEQAKTGFSLQDQIFSCRSRLLSLGLTNIQEYIDDGYSGEFLDRPALDCLREDLRAKIIKAVVIYDPDRLSRNLTNQLLLADDIEKAQAQLMFVTGDYDASPEGRLFFSIRGAISAFEKAKIRERTIRGKTAKAKSGKIVLNNNPYGFDWDAENSTYMINEEQAEVVRLIYKLSLTNYWGSPKISIELSDRGIFNHNNKPFNAVHIHRILTKELYCGIAYSKQVTTKKTGQYTVEKTKRPKSDWIPIPIPAIVTHEQWEQVQNIIAQNAKLSSRNTKREYLLRGLLRCGVCGMGLVASHLKTSGNTRYYYRCVTKSSSLYRNIREKCNNRCIPVEALEETIWNMFLNLASGESDINDYLQLNDIPDHSLQIEKLTKKYEELASQRIEITKWYKAKIIDPVTAEIDLQKLTKEMNIITVTIDSLQTAQKNIKKMPTISIEHILSAKTFEEKRELLIRSGFQFNVARTGKNVEIKLIL